MADQNEQQEEQTFFQESEQLLAEEQLQDIHGAGARLSCLLGGERAAASHSVESQAVASHSAHSSGPQVAMGYPAEATGYPANVMGYPSGSYPVLPVTTGYHSASGQRIPPAFHVNTAPESNPLMPRIVFDGSAASHASSPRSGTPNHR